MGRNLVRWNDDHDKELLLWTVYCCNESGLKIPFDKVAYYMGANFTEGAIVQHLAKVRVKMEESGLHPPPAQKRGLTTRAPSSIYRKARTTTRAAEPRPPIQDEDGDDAEQGSMVPFKNPGIAQPRPRAAPRSRKVKKEASVKQESGAEDNLERDPDGEYSVQTSKRKRLSSGHVSMPSRTKRGKKSTQSILEINPAGGINAYQDELASTRQLDSPGSQGMNVRPKSRTDTAGPARRTRGLRADYTQEDIVNSEDDEEQDAVNNAGAAHGLAVSEQHESFIPDALVQNVYQPINQTWMSQKNHLPAAYHGLDPTFNGYNISQASGYTSMAPPAEIPSNPVPYPSNFSHFTPGTSEPVSRVHSMSSAASPHTFNAGASWDPRFKNENAAAHNAFGTFTEHNSMNYNTGANFDNTDVLAPIMADHSVHHDANKSNFDFGLPSLAHNDHYEALPPVNGASLDFDALNFDDYGNDSTY